MENQKKKNEKFPKKEEIMSEKSKGKKEGRGGEEVGNKNRDFLDGALVSARSLKPIKMTLYKWFHGVSCVYYICLWLFHTFIHI